jgi:hypothetical protein
VGGARAVVAVGPKNPDLWLEPRALMLHPGSIQEIWIEGGPGAKIMLQNRRPPMNWSTEGQVGRILGRDTVRKISFEASEDPGFGFVRLDIGRFEKARLSLRAPVLVGEQVVPLTPRLTTLKPGETLRFTPQNRSLPLEWSIVPEEAGTITQDGILTVKGGDVIHVIARVPGSHGGGGGISVVRVK